MSTHSTVGKDVERPAFTGFMDIGESRISPKSRTIDYYLYLIEPYFDRLEVYSTEGDYRTPYPFQWWAFAKLFEGHEDAYEGKGGSPVEAMRNLYESIKQGEAIGTQEER